MVVPKYLPLGADLPTPPPLSPRGHVEIILN
jgi:hypothetical protein